MKNVEIEKLQKLQKKVFDSEKGKDHGNLNFNKNVKAVILEFEDKSVVVENKNYGTRKKYMCFDKEKSKLHPMQIVFCGLEIDGGHKFIDRNNEIQIFKDYYKEYMQKNNIKCVF